MYRVVIFVSFLAVLFTMVGVFVYLKPVLAQNDTRSQIMGQIQAGAASAELGEGQDPRLIIASIIKVALGLLGTVFMVLVFMGGYWLITARGEEEKVRKAQDTIKRAVIGLIIITLAYAITNFVAGGIEKAVYGG